MKSLKITSPDFSDNGFMPIKNTGFGEDVPPAFDIENIDERVLSLAVIMDDMDIPFIGELNHCLVWNIPRTSHIDGKIIDSAVMGIGWGKHCYRGPKQPFFVRKTHRYRFSFYALDAFLDLDAEGKKEDLIAAMEGHILQTGSIIGLYKRK